MNRTIKDATVKVFHYDDLESLKTHVLAFVTAHNFARHLKALRWRTPFQAICDAWTKEPSIFKINPHHFISGTTQLEKHPRPRHRLLYRKLGGRVVDISVRRSTSDHGAETILPPEATPPSVVVGAVQVS
jgi:hypothetical protein